MNFEDFASTEEWEFYNWLLEVERYGIVSEIEYQPNTFTLSKKVWYTENVKYLTKAKKTPKVKIVTRGLLRPCTYTPDFRFDIHNSLIQSIIKNTHAMPCTKTIVDTKGNFAGKKNNGAITFPVKQKWLYQTHGLYVEKVIPEKLFKMTFVPEVARLSPKKKQPVKKYIGCKTIIEFIENQSKQQ